MTENLKIEKMEVEPISQMTPPVIQSPNEALPAKPTKTKKKKEIQVETPVAPITRKVTSVCTVPIAEQKKWEKRPYMRNPDDAPEIVRHESTYGVNEAKIASLIYMQNEYAKSGKTEFLIGELAKGINSRGPAWSDCVRSAMRKLKEDKVVKIHIGKWGRALYKVELCVAPPVAEVTPPAV